MKTAAICFTLVIAAVLITDTYCTVCCTGNKKGECGGTVDCVLGIVKCYKWVDDAGKQTEVIRGCDIGNSICTGLTVTKQGTCFNCDKDKCNSGVSIAAQMSLISASAVMVMFTKLFL